MHSRDVRLQAAVMKEREILLLNARLDDGRQFWLLPGGGREFADVDDFAAVAREVREELGVDVVVEQVLLEEPAHPDDTTYQRYRTFACRLRPGAVVITGIRDGVATIRDVRWLALEDEDSWDLEIATDRFLAPQLRAIRTVLLGRPATERDPGLEGATQASRPRSIYSAMDSGRGIARAERLMLWQDTRHWERFGVYRCAEDARLVVPQRDGWGWTVNMAHPKAQVALWGFCGSVVAFVIGLFVIVARAI